MTLVIQIWRSFITRAGGAFRTVTSRSRSSRNNQATHALFAPVSGGAYRCGSFSVRFRKIAFRAGKTCDRRNSVSRPSFKQYREPFGGIELMHSGVSGHVLGGRKFDHETAERARIDTLL